MRTEHPWHTFERKSQGGLFFFFNLERKESWAALKPTVLPHSLMPSAFLSPRLLESRMFAIPRCPSAAPFPYPSSSKSSNPGELQSRGSLNPMRIHQELQPCRSPMSIHHAHVHFKRRCANCNPLRQAQITQISP